MAAGASRLEGLRSASPSSPTPAFRDSVQASGPFKRHTSEAPSATRSVTKRRRLLSVTRTDEAGGTRNSQSTRLTLFSPDDNSEEEDELSIVYETTAAPSASSAPLAMVSAPVGQPAPTTSSIQMHPRQSHSLASKQKGQRHTPLTAGAKEAIATVVESPASGPGPATGPLTSPRSAAVMDQALGHKVISFGTRLLAAPPQPQPLGAEAADAAAQVSLLQEEYNAVRNKLAAAKSRLEEQLMSDLSTPGTTPVSSFRTSGDGGGGLGGDDGAMLAADEEDAVASALSRINGLEVRRSGLMGRLNEAKLAELDAEQQRDSRQLLTRIENKRLYRWLMELGPTGTASLLRVLLIAAGVAPAAEDSAELETSADVEDRRAWIKRELERDILREGLAAPAGSSTTASGRRSRKPLGPGEEGGREAAASQATNCDDRPSASMPMAS